MQIVNLRHTRHFHSKRNKHKFVHNISLNKRLQLALVYKPYLSNEYKMMALDEIAHKIQVQDRDYRWILDNFAQFSSKTLQQKLGIIHWSFKPFDKRKNKQ